MPSAVSSFGFAYLCLAFAALHLSTFLDPQCGAAGTGGTTTSAEAPLLHSAAEVLPPFAALVVLFLAVALIYRHLMGSHVLGNNRRAVSRLVMLVLCVSAGTLEFIVFGKVVGAGAAGHGAQARALALRALPAAVTATFFLGIVLIVVAHVRAGGEGGGGAVAGDGPVQGLFLRLLTKVAAGMAAALVGLIVMAVVTLYDAKC